MGLFGKKKNISNPDDDFFDFKAEAASDSFFDTPQETPFGLKDSLDGAGGDRYSSGSSGGFSLDDDGDGGGKGGNSRKRRKGNMLAKLAGVLVPILIIIAIGGAVYFGYSFITGPRRGECKELLHEFEQASNKLDLDEMAECLEPSLCNKIKAALLVTKMITKQDMNDLVGLIVESIGSGLIPDTGDTTLEVSDILKTISIEPVKYGFPGKTRVVKCKVSIAGITEYVNFTIKKENGDVYIAKAAITKK